MLIRVTSTAVRMELMTAAAMLTRATAPSTTTARPSPVEAAPPPEDADPGLHMVVPFRAWWPPVTSGLTQRGGEGPGRRRQRMILASLNLHGGRRADGTPFDVADACRQLHADTVVL